MRTTLTLCTALLLACALAAPTQAQRYSQYARAAVEAPQVLARGGTAVALPSADAALFYNPAQLARLQGQRVRVEVLGVQTGVNGKFFGDLGFLMDDIIPAVEEGFNFPLSPEDRALFDDALDRGRLPTVGRAAVTLPQITVPTAWGGVSGGFFGQTTARYRFEDVGGGIPLLDLFTQADAIGAVGAAARIPNSPMAVGVTGRYARRAIGFKYKDLLSIDTEAEEIYLIGGSTFAFDVGVHAEGVAARLPGRLDVGLAVYDLIGGGFDYALERRIELTGQGAASSRELDQVLGAFDGRDGRVSFRLGAAYHVPPLAAVPALRHIAVTADYVSVSTSESEQPLLGHLRLGAEAQALGFARVRAGVLGGYPSLGLGLESRIARLEYAFYGEEDGRLPGQLPRFNHLVQLRLGRF
jgi:hypothetical protein